jgi:hypothetical protein
MKTIFLVMRPGAGPDLRPQAFASNTRARRAARLMVDARSRVCLEGADGGYRVLGSLHGAVPPVAVTVDVVPVEVVA